MGRGVGQEQGVCGLDILEVSLPVLEGGDPLVELNCTDTADVLES
jgi:hypothetical protein